MFLFLFPVGIVHSAETDLLEIKVKAAYLYNFLRFVEWPDNRQYTADICVYGIHESYRPAFSSLATLPKQSQQLTIELFKDTDDLKSLNSCQIIFITDKAYYKSKAIFEHLKGGQVLTIGETTNFIKLGGMINFIRVEDKIRFEINPARAEAAGLKISSKVLRIAVRLVSMNSHE